MHRQSFTLSSLRKCIRNSDFNASNYDNIKNSLDETLLAAINCAKYGFTDRLVLNRAILNKKPIYKLLKLSDILVLRKATNNIRYAYEIKQPNRNMIIDSVRPETPFF